MSEHWVQTTLGSISKAKGGRRLPKGSDLISTKTSHPYIRTKDIENHRICMKEIRYVPDDVFPSIQRYTVDADDLVVSIVGTVGSCAIVPSELHKANLTENCAKIVEIDCRKTTRLFLYYFLVSEQGQRCIEEKIVGSTQPKLPLYGIESIPINLPPLQEQKAITHILGALDDKIELNRKTNETLEAMAKALFKSWFVDFDPVKAKAEGRPTGLPAEISDLFPDSFEDSELGAIPSDWKISSLGNEFNWKEGKPWNKEDRVERSAVSVFGANGSIGFGAKQMGNSRVIFVGKIGSCGAINCHKGAFWATNNTHFLSLDENPFLEYARQVIGVVDFSQYIGGSSNPYMPFGNFAHHQTLSPSLDILRVFCEYVTPLRESIECREDRSTTLRSLRDTLLPKLISGEIRIPDAEKMLEEVGV